MRLLRCGRLPGLVIPDLVRAYGTLDYCKWATINGYQADSQTHTLEIESDPRVVTTCRPGVGRLDSSWKCEVGERDIRDTSPNWLYVTHGPFVTVVLLWTQCLSWILGSGYGKALSLNSSEPKLLSTIVPPWFNSCFLCTTKVTSGDRRQLTCGEGSE